MLLEAMSPIGMNVYELTCDSNIAAPSTSFKFSSFGIDSTIPGSMCFAFVHCSSLGSTSQYSLNNFFFSALPLYMPKPQTPL